MLRMLGLKISSKSVMNWALSCTKFYFCLFYILIDFLGCCAYGNGLMINQTSIRHNDTSWSSIECKPMTAQTKIHTELTLTQGLPAPSCFPIGCTWYILGIYLVYTIIYYVYTLSIYSVYTMYIYWVYTMYILCTCIVYCSNKICIYMVYTIWYIPCIFLVYTI